MKLYPLRALVLLVSAFVLVGCATSPSDAAAPGKPGQPTYADNAVGSRIRRAQKQAGPTQEIGQEDLQQMDQRTTTETIKTLQAGRN
jgi:hypothetical protein